MKLAAPVVLEPRGDRRAPLVFKEGAQPPYAIRWYGATSLFGHFRNLVASAIASESIDSRDWMRPLAAGEMLESVTRVLGLPCRGTLVESLDRPLWIDWVADTGDDHDVSRAVGEMIFREYAVADGDATLTLPRGDVLLFGGDTAYPVATAEEIHRRVVDPWNGVLQEHDDYRARPRVLLGIPGNHDWYDGLDGFARFFRRDMAPGDPSAELPAPESVLERPAGRKVHRSVGLAVRRLHLDELGSIPRMIASAGRALLALWQGRGIHRRGRLTLQGYEAVQESSYWALPVAPGLDLWGVDRQLRGMDFRQRAYFRGRKEALGEQASIWFCAPDPALAYGERWRPGARMLKACELSLERDHVLYLSGDVHQYERREVGRSLHVIAGGGGAFLHGTRIVADPKPAAAAYPSAAITRRLVLQVPFKLLVGRAGYLVHMAAAALAAIELGIGWNQPVRLVWASAIATATIVWLLYVIAGHRRAHPGRVFALAVPFGLSLGLLPLGLSVLLRHVAATMPLLGRDTGVILVYALLASLLFGSFLALCALGGLDMQQAFTVLGHPGFKHFVRLRVSPDGTIDAWAIGKDDPLVREGPWLIDRWSWNASPSRVTR